MTLILSSQLGGVMVAMSSDTRQSAKLTLFGATIDMPFKDSEGKISRISPYCIFGGGGTNEIIDAIKGYINEHKGETIFVSDFKPLIDNAVVSLQSIPKYRDMLKDETAAQILISGFNHNGTCGVLLFNTGADLAVKYKAFENFEQDIQVIAPSEDEVEQIKSAVFPEVKVLQELPSAVVSYFVSIQSACFEINPEAVSETCNYCVLFRDPVSLEFQCFEGTLKVNE